MATEQYSASGRSWDRSLTGPCVLIRSQERGPDRMPTDWLVSTLGPVGYESRARAAPPP